MSVGAQCHHPNVTLLDVAAPTAGPPTDKRYLWCRDCGLLLNAFPTDKERKREEAAHTATIIQRDMLHDIADELAERIAKITGVEIGEHSSNNDPWMKAKYAADEYLATPAGAGAPSIEPVGEPVARFLKFGESIETHKLCFVELLGAPVPDAKLYTAPQPAPEKAEAAVTRLQAECDEIAVINHTMWLAVENIRLLAARHRKEEWAQHVLRFCADAGNASNPLRCPTHPEQKAEAAVPAGLVSDLSLLVMRMARRLSITDVESVHVVGNKNLAQQATDYLRRKGLTSPLREDATPSPTGTTPTEGQA